MLCSMKIYADKMKNKLSGKNYLLKFFIFIMKYQFIFVENNVMIK